MIQISVRVRPEIKATLFGVLAYFAAFIACTIIIVIVEASFLGFDGAKTFAHTPTGSFSNLALLLLAPVLCGGYFAGRTSKAIPIKSSALIGVIPVFFTLAFWNSGDSDPVWVSIFSIATPIPLAMFGGYLAMKKNALTANTHIPPQRQPKDSSDDIKSILKRDLEELKEANPEKYKRTMYARNVSRFLLLFFCLPVSFFATYMLGKIIDFGPASSSNLKFLLFFVLAFFMQSPKKMSLKDWLSASIVFLAIIALVFWFTYLSIPSIEIAIGILLFIGSFFISGKIKDFILFHRFGPIAVEESKVRIDEIRSKIKTNKNETSFREDISSRQENYFRWGLSFVVISFASIALGYHKTYMVMLFSGVVSILFARSNLLKFDLPFYVAASFLSIFISLVFAGLAAGVATRQGLPEDSYVGPALMVGVLLAIICAFAINRAVVHQNTDI